MIARVVETLDAYRDDTTADIRLVRVVKVVLPYSKSTRQLPTFNAHDVALP